MTHPFTALSSCRIFILLCVFFAVSAGLNVAQAQTSRIYFAGYLGLNSNLESDFDESTAPASGSFGYKNAGSFAGAIGLRVNRNIRLEAEISYRDADFNDVDLNGSGTFDIGGSLKTWLFMLNGYYDFDLKWWNLEPFLTAGLGLAHHDGTIGDPPGAAPSASDDALALGWQIGGGLKYRVSEDMAFTGGYRYLGTTNFDLNGYDLGYDTHEIRFGVEYDLPIQ